LNFVDPRRSRYSYQIRDKNTGLSIHLNGGDAMDMLDTLQDIGWAIWFGDKGFYASSRRVGLRTTAYGIEGNKTICQYFNELDVPCEMRKDLNTARIVFSKEGTNNFLKIIAIRLDELGFAKKFLY